MSALSPDPVRCGIGWVVRHSGYSYRHLLRLCAHPNPLQRLPVYKVRGRLRFETKSVKAYFRGKFNGAKELPEHLRK